jgi:RHS repeat-associated protein
MDTNYTTTYLYDGLNDLIGVSQGTRTICQINSVWYYRCFQYDSLGRMTRATTPESGTVNYTYDSDSTCGTSKGDLVKRVDARGIRTCHAYDSRHRLTSNTYSDATPTANYYYDQSSYNSLTITNGLGERTGMSDGSGESAWSFDAMGRMVKQEKTIAGVTRSISYAYNFDGSVATLTYPDGRGMNYTYNSNGQAVSVVGSGGFNWAVNTTYAAHGALASMINGQSSTFTGVTYSVNYNNRLLPSSISASSSNGTALNLAYGYFPNANVETITNSVDNGRTATYGYDSLNRINSASTQATSGADCWGQTVPSTGYDRYGNLLTINVSKCTAPTLSVSVNAKNQITNTGFSYDASGNETADGTNTYTWDAESRMTSGADVTYTFDGSGERVKDSSPKLYWYGQDGSVLEETDASGNYINAYVYFDGMRVGWITPTITDLYYSDALGSEHTITNDTGHVCYDADFYPFGGEHAYTSNCVQNYKFAGMERDSATGFDHTMFRQYSSNVGRWISPDPLQAGAVSLANPQSWNMYAYVVNNPTNFVDPLGLCDLNGANVDGTVTCSAECGDSGCSDSTNVYVTPDPDPIDSSTAHPDCPIGDVCISVPGGAPGGTASGGGGGAPNNGTPWYKTCTAQALFSGAGSIAIDSIGLIPEAEGFTKVFENTAGYQLARAAGNSAGYRGVVATQYGMKAVAQGKGGAALISGAFGLGDTTVEGRISTGLTVAGFIPGLGTAAAASSIGVDGYKTWKAVSQCP